ncbi:MAG: ANTAR domain-containing protein [Maritimibacter sp.]|nr:ANTAR domain-containing protein [Maritimibacter sp.]
MTRPLELNFSGRRAVVLHPAQTVREALVARLEALGLSVAASWPPEPDAATRADVLFVDVDTGHDALFPWGTAQAPVPVIGLVRSEAPGRLAWALERNLDAFLPLTALGNVYSTLVIAAAHCRARQDRAAQDAETARRGALRHVLVRATMALMARDGVDDLTALKQIRARAMRTRVPLEDAAAEILAETGETRARGRT